MSKDLPESEFGTESNHIIKGIMGEQNIM